MPRRFGIITTVAGLTTGFVVNELTYDETVESAEARNEKGEITDLTAFSRSTSLTASGVLDDTNVLIRAGDKLTIEGKDWLIESVNRTESNTAFVTVSITARRADNAVITPIAATPATPPENP